MSEKTSILDSPSWQRVRARQAGCDPVFLPFDMRANVVLQLFHLTQRLSDSHQKMILEGRVAVGIVNADTPDAFVESVDPDGFAIFLNSATMLLLYDGIRRLSPFIRTGKYTQEDLRAATLDIADSLDWLSTVGTPGDCRDYQVEAEDIRFAEEVTFEAERFLIAHELGHVDMADNDPGNLPRDSSAAHELEADQRGLRMLLNQGSDPNPAFVEASIASAVLFCSMLSFAEHFGCLTHPNYPKAKERLHNVLATAEPYRKGRRPETPPYVDRCVDCLHRIQGMLPSVDSATIWERRIEQTLRHIRSQGEG